jgi:energy-converting hydrogenase Eha subunit E
MNLDPDKQPKDISKGVEIRAMMDLEVGRSLILINGAGIIALLTFLATVLERPELRPMIPVTVGSVAVLIVGLFCAIMHIRFGRKCSLRWQQNDMFEPPPERWLGFTLAGCRPCVFSTWMLWLAVLAFISVGALMCVKLYCQLAS